MEAVAVPENFSGGARCEISKFEASAEAILGYFILEKTKIWGFWGERAPVPPSPVDPPLRGIL